MKAKDESIQKLKDSPHTYYSCYQSYIQTNSKTITYSSLLHASTNVEGSDMNIATGVFRSGQGGTYTVSWSLRGDTTSGLILNIYLRRNGVKITESLHRSYYNGDKFLVQDQGG